MLAVEDRPRLVGIVSRKDILPPSISTICGNQPWRPRRRRTSTAKISARAQAASGDHSDRQEAQNSTSEANSSDVQRYFANDATSDGIDVDESDLDSDDSDGYDLVSDFQVYESYAAEVRAQKKVNNEGQFPKSS